MCPAADGSVCPTRCPAARCPAADARRDVRQCAKIIKKNVSRIEKRRIFAAAMKRMYLQYTNQRACPSVPAERFVVNTPPDCNSLPINSLRESMDSAADRKSGAFEVFRGFNGFKGFKVSRFQGFRGFRGFRGFSLMTLIDFNDFKKLYQK